MLELNLKNKATTQNSLPFTSMCRFGDKYLGVNEAGLYQLGGYNDNDVAIPGYIKSGMMDFGTNNTKRFRFFYFGLHATGRLNLKVYCDDALAGEYQVDGTGDMSVRVPISRMHQGRYWAWSVENVSGAFFALYSVEALPVVLSSGR